MTQATQQDMEPVAWVVPGVLAELQKHKTATGTISSPMLKAPFGDQIPLYTHPAAVNANCSKEVVSQWLELVDMIEIGPEPDEALGHLRASLVAALTPTVSP